MRRFLATLALMGLVQMSVGCKHTAGTCDCGMSPGESVPVSTSHKPIVATPVGMPVPMPPTQTIEPIPAPRAN